MSARKPRYPEIAPEFNEAIRLKNEGRLAHAERIFLDLTRRAPIGATFGMLGHVQEKLGKLGEAAASYRRATECSPGSELASISLFHALFELGDLDAAFAEMLRFRWRGPSPEYDLLIRDVMAADAAEEAP